MWPDQDETLELLKNAKLGDRQAVDRLMDRHRGALQRMVRTRLNPGMAARVDASDIVQDALLTASRRLAEYLGAPRMPFHAWLRHLARDRLADAYRRELADKRNVARELHDGGPDEDRAERIALVPDTSLTPATNFLRKEFAERFHAALDTLSDESREIVLMRHAEQLSNSQAAELLGVSEAAAGMRYLRALRRLKSVLGEASTNASDE